MIDGDAHYEDGEDASEIPAQAFDPSLPKTPLRAWLQDVVGPDEKWTWGLGECDLKPGHDEPMDGYPMCVAASAGRHNIGIRLHILVGTFERGVFGVPTLHGQSFMSCLRVKEGVLRLKDIRRLSDLSANMAAFLSDPACK